MFSFKNALISTELVNNITKSFGDAILNISNNPVKAVEAFW